MDKQPDTPLDAYLLKAGTSDAEFALAISRDRSMVNKLRRGKLTPTLDVAAAIERATDGAIKMQDWTDLAAKPRARAEAA